MHLGRLRHVAAGPLVLSTAAAFLFADVVIVWIGSQVDFAFDFACCYQQAAARLIESPGSLYEWSETYTFRYTPLGALAFIPLVPLSEGAATIVFLAVKVAVLTVAAIWFSARWHVGRRWLVALMVLSFPPLIHDIVIGNVSTFTFLVLLAVARWPDPRGGVVLGALSILAPKPHLIPILAWMAVRRPRDFTTALATMAVGVAIGLLVFGADPWLAFLRTLREPLERTFTANIGFSALLGPPGVIVGAVAALGLWLYAVRTPAHGGYGLAILSGIALGPYTFIHYLAGALVAAEPALRDRPRSLTPFPWLLIVFPLIPLWTLLFAWVIGRHHAAADRPPGDRLPRVTDPHQGS